MIDFDKRFGADGRARNAVPNSFSEPYRQALKSACSEDQEIWQIYAMNFGPDSFDECIDQYISNPANRTFILFDGDQFAGMTSFLGIDSRRQVLEIGGTYYRPRFRGTGFNSRVKAHVPRPGLSTCGIRRVEFRVDRRNRRSQAAMRSWARSARGHPLGPSDLDRPRPRYGPICHPQGRMAGLTSCALRTAAVAKLYFYYAAMNAGKSTTLLRPITIIANVRHGNDAVDCGAR